MSRPRTSGLPRCPDRHVGHVILWGHYGGKHLKGSRARTSRRRQRFKCVPRRGTEHTFTEALPRLQPRPPAPVSCIECDRVFTGRDAPAGPRKHSYSISEIAGGLLAVGEGKAYRQASAQIRADAHVHGSGHSAVSLYTNREFGLVADWVELFGAHIAKTLLPARWPDGPGSTAVLDALPFALSGHINAATGFPMHGGVAAWTVLAAATYIGSELLIVRLRAVPGAPDAHDWAELLVSLPGVPQRTVTDIDNAILAGIRLAWPSAIRLIAWDKLRRRLVEADDSAVKKDKRHRVYDVLAQCAADAFEGRRQWINFVRWARVSPRPKHTNAWLRRHARRVHTQLRAMPYWPGDSGPLEQRLAVLRDFFVERKGMIANQDRTNLLLGLMAVQFNGRRTSAATASSSATSSTRPRGRRRGTTLSTRHRASIDRRPRATSSQDRALLA